MVKAGSRSPSLSLMNNKLSYMVSSYTSEVGPCIIQANILVERGDNFPNTDMLGGNNYKNTKIQ